MDGASGTPCEGGHHSSLGLPSWAMCVGRGAERGVGEEILRKSVGCTSRQFSCIMFDSKNEDRYWTEPHVGNNSLETLNSSVR